MAVRKDAMTDEAQQNRSEYGGNETPLHCTTLAVFKAPCHLSPVPKHWPVSMKG